MLSACSGKTLHVESDTSWSGSVDQFGPVEGHGNARYDLGDTHGQVCWKIDKAIDGRRPARHADDDTWFGLGSEIDGIFYDRADSARVEGCSNEDPVVAATVGLIACSAESTPSGSPATCGSHRRIGRLAAWSGRYRPRSPIVIRVVDGNGLPTPAVPVTWASARGSITVLDDSTGDDGTARAVWTLPATPGADQAGGRRDQCRHRDLQRHGCPGGGVTRLSVSRRGELSHLRHHHQRAPGLLGIRSGRPARCRRLGSPTVPDTVARRPPVSARQWGPLSRVRPDARGHRAVLGQQWRRQAGQRNPRRLERSRQRHQRQVSI